MDIYGSDSRGCCGIIQKYGRLLRDLPECDIVPAMARALLAGLQEVRK